jgi:hypothetical protein
MQSVSRQLLASAGIESELFAAVLDAGRRDAAKKCHSRAGGKGRMILPLVGKRHLHLADAPLLAPLHREHPGQRRIPAVEASRLLRDPALPVASGPRWGGTWRPAEEEGERGTRLFRACLTAEDVDRLCHASPELWPGLFVDFADVDEATAEAVGRALAAWELEWGTGRSERL